MNLQLELGRRGRVVLVLLGLVLALVVAAAVLVLPAERDSVATPGPRADAGATRLQAVAARPAGKAPHRLAVPSLDIDAPLDPIEVSPDGVLTPPDDGDVVGWWKRSAQPGARQGQTVVTGHTIRSGPAVMNKLGTVDKGAVVKVYDDGVVVHYRVTDVVTYSVAEVAKKAYDLFAQDRGDGRLVMVTCTDYVNGDYRSNVIVFAEPTGQSRARGDA